MQAIVVPHSPLDLASTQFCKAKQLQINEVTL